jgi:hypothetical protein
MYDDRVLSYNEKASVYNDGLSSSFNRENIVNVMSQILILCYDQNLNEIKTMFGS